MLFENYEQFVHDEDNNLNSPDGASRLLREDASYEDFADTLLEGLDDSARNSAKAILDQQRLHLLSEGAANVSASVFSHKIRWV